MLPVWGIGADGLCCCGNANCGKNAGKHPLGRLVPNGVQDATTDLAVIDAWWLAEPNANPAIATGPSSWLVMDGEGDDGPLEVRQWCAGFGLDLPDTLEADTGGGGKHLVYVRSMLDLPSRIRFLEHADTRASTGYVVVPPALHRSGRRYSWARWCLPAPAPIELERRLLVTKGRSFSTNGQGPSYDYREACKTGPRAGYRDEFFNARAFELRKLGYTGDQAAQEMHRLWELCEQPAGDDYPIERVAEKLLRVYGTVEPDVVPDWPAGVASSARQGDDEGTWTAPPPPKDLLSDAGNGWRLVNRHGVNWRWTPELDHRNPHVIWDGTIWRADTKNRIHELALETVTSIFTDEVLKEQDETRRAVLTAWGKRSYSHASMRDMVREASGGYDAVKASITEFDREPTWLATPSGTLELREHRLREHRRDDYIMRISAVTCDLTARDERWDRYVWSTFNGDQDLIAYVQRLCGYFMTGSVEEKILPIFYGPNDTGKTTLTNALGAVLGIDGWGYCTTVRPEELMHRSEKAMSEYTVASFQGRRLVIAQEPSEGERFAEGPLKHLTGGDPPSGRHPFGRPFTFLPSHKLLIVTNHKPMVRDDTLLSRIRVIPFTTQVAPEHRDRTLRDELTQDASVTRAAFAWFAAGASAYLQDGLGACDAVTVVTKVYEREQDVVGLFAEENLRITGEGERSRLAMAVVYRAYVMWIEEHGERPWSQRRLATKLKERGFWIDKTAIGSTLFNCALVNDLATWPQFQGGTQDGV